MDYKFKISQGLVARRTLVQKYGFNPDTDTGTDPEDIWENGGLYTGQPDHSADAETVNVVSDDVNDTSAGTGARTIQIYGLDQNWRQVNEIITLDGTTPVTSTNQYHRLYRAKVLTAGSGGTIAGTVTIQHTTTSANVFASVTPNNNQTNVAAFTMPVDKSGYIDFVNVQMSRVNGSDGSAVIQILVREENGVYLAKRNVEITNSMSYNPGDIYLYLPPKSDVIFRILSVSDNSTRVSAEFHIVEILE